jgi:hypothetical protein
MDDWLSENRSTVLVVLFALLLFNIGYWVISNLAGLRWGPAGVEPTQLAAEIGLTLGTVALAASGFLQARAAQQQTMAAAAQNELAKAEIEVAKSQADAARRQAWLLRAQALLLTRPSLRIQFKAASARFGTTDEPQVLSPGDYIPTGEEDRAIYVHNVGPGVAWEVTAEMLGLGAVATFDEVKSPIPMKCARMLGPGESTQVVLPGPMINELWPKLGQYSPKFAVIVRVQASSTDLDPDDPYAGDSATYSASGGLILDQGRTDPGDVRRLVWRILTEGECEQLASRQAEPNSLPEAWGSTGPPIIKGPPKVPTTVEALTG